VIDDARAALGNIDYRSTETLEARLKQRTLSEVASHALLGGANRTQLRNRDEAAELAMAGRLAERADERQLTWH
jgi:hypothetical protein